MFRKNLSDIWFIAHLIVHSTEMPPHKYARLEFLDHNQISEALFTSYANVILCSKNKTKQSVFQVKCNDYKQETFNNKWYHNKFS